MAETVSEVARVQKPAPDFTAEAVMPDGSIGEVRLSDYRGRYVVLFFYPLDFTFVCPTEVNGFADRIGDFRSRGCEVIGVSVDSVHAHLAWRRMPREEGGIGAVPYPLVSDLDKRISRAYGVLLDKPEVALRGVFLIDREGILRAAHVNDLPLGRNVDEVLRLLDALQHVERYGEVCPAGWRPGERGMRPDQEGLREYARERYAAAVR
jgi:peroxiredoxin (alkyl hydroperoxide reductase subunit C)